MNIIKTLLPIALPMAMATAACAADTVVQQVRHAGPFKVQQPLLLDSVNNAQQRYSPQSLVATPLSLQLTDGQPLRQLAELKLDTAMMHLVRFDVDAHKYLTGVKLNVKG